MIFDCFLFNKEFDVLDIRKNELRGLDITHILIEGFCTFRGNIKPLYYADAFGDQGKDGMYNYVAASPPNNGNPWDNEKYQRNVIADALKKFNPKDDDIVIVSDVDEIPRAESVLQYKPQHGLASLTMDVYWYKLNCLCDKQTWNHPKIMTYGMLKNTTPDKIRSSQSKTFLPNAGWHFSYIGDENFIVDKIKSFSHSELDVPSNTTPGIVREKIENGKALWGEAQFQFVNIEYPTFPKYLVENQHKFKHLIKYFRDDKD